MPSRLANTIVSGVGQDSPTWKPDSKTVTGVPPDTGTRFKILSVPLSTCT